MFVFVCFAFAFVFDLLSLSLSLHLSRLCVCVCICVCICLCFWYVVCLCLCRTLLTRILGLLTLTLQVQRGTIRRFAVAGVWCHHGILRKRDRNQSYYCVKIK
jgi:hypothetical protein